MKVLPFENSVSENLEEGDGNTQNISKTSLSSQKEFSNGNCQITTSTLDASTISKLDRHANFTYQENYLCKKVRRGDLTTYNKQTSKARNQRMILKNTDMVTEPFCIASKRKCKGNSILLVIVYLICYIELMPI